MVAVGVSEQSLTTRRMASTTVIDGMDIQWTKDQKAVLPYVVNKYRYGRFCSQMVVMQ
jgi:hypothetical protein